MLARVLPVLHQGRRRPQPRMPSRCARRVLERPAWAGAGLQCSRQRCVLLQSGRTAWRPWHWSWCARTLARARRTRRLSRRQCAGRPGGGFPVWMSAWLLRHVFRRRPQHLPALRWTHALARGRHRARRDRPTACEARPRPKTAAKPTWSDRTASAHFYQELTEAFPARLTRGKGGASSGAADPVSPRTQQRSLRSRFLDRTARKPAKRPGLGPAVQVGAQFPVPFSRFIFPSPLERRLAERNTRQGETRAHC